MTATHSEWLREKLALVLAPASAASRALWSHPRVAELVPEYLFSIHCSARATIPLMEAVRERAEQLAPDDRVAAGLARYLEKHIPEELHHDEWFLEDLEALGVPRQRTLSRIPPVSVAAMVGAQYYWALHYHPVALLGFFAVLEGYPASAQQLEVVIARSGLPRRGFRTLLEHSDLDRDHRDELHETLDGLPLTAQHSALIAVSAFATLHLAACTLEEVVQSLAVETDAPDVSWAARVARRGVSPAPRVRGRPRRSTSPPAPSAR
jgi:heme oxygenase-like protein